MPGQSTHPEDDFFTRRNFIAVGGGMVGATAIGWSAAGAGDSGTPNAGGGIETLGEIPRRTLGKTGVQVSRLGLGTACMGEGPQNAEECAAVFSEAIDRGINYVDTARIYGDAETALGKVLKTRRDKVFLVTKCMTNTAEDARKSFETSLREMQVDNVDLLHLHATGDRDLDVVLGPGGAWEHLLRMKKDGKTRFVGITGHSRPQNFVRMLETGQVDVMMVAMNFVDRHTYGFEEKVLPLARKLGTGVMAMKVYGGIRGGFAFNRQRRPSQLDPVFLQIALRYSLNLEGVTGTVIGVHDAEELRQTIRYVLSAPPLSKTEMASLEEHGKKLSEIWGPRFGPVA